MGGMITEMDRVQQWLFSQVEAMRSFGESEELMARAIAGVDALVAAGALTASEAELWLAQMADLGGPLADGPTDAAGEALLAELPADGQRHEGAFHMLRVLGKVPAGADAEMPVWESDRALDQSDLVAVRPGPDERQGPRRVLAMLRFAAGVAFLIDDGRTELEDLLEWSDWRMTDDAGTRYVFAGGAGQPTFHGLVPALATWVELSVSGKFPATFRVAL
jgi:hypothetical protein